MSSQEATSEDPQPEHSSSTPITSSLSLQDKIHQNLQQDILGADFLASLFWAAMSSFRHDSILRPFPPGYVHGQRSEITEGNRSVEHEKDIERLREVFGSLASLNDISSGRTKLSSQQAELLCWILNPKKITVASVSLSRLDDLLDLVGDAEERRSSQLNLPQNPKHIFELKYSKEAESKFQSIAQEYGTTFAFHGSSLENFYSIVHNGLLNIFNKVAAFGEGNYLSAEMSVCLNWSPCGSLWPQSSLPHAASCVALCELVKHPSVMSRSQVGGEPSLQQRIPEKYYVVKNDELMRVKYIFVFGMHRPVVQRRRWECRNKFVWVLLFYLAFLFYIGTTQSKVLKRFIRRYYNYFTT